MLTRRQRYDYYDTDPTELTLIRIGQAILATLRRERRQKRLTASEETALYDAIEIMMKLKAEYRAELKKRRAARSQKTREYFERRKSK